MKLGSKMKLNEAIEVIRIYKEGNVMVAHERLMEAIDTVVAEVEKPLAKNEWISTLVQMPEENQKVLAYNGYRIVYTSWQKFTDQDDNWFKTGYTHWMPMIELPKIKKSND